MRFLSLDDHLDEFGEKNEILTARMPPKPFYTQLLIIRN